MPLLSIGPDARSMTRHPGLRALAYPRFRLYLGGQLISLTGSWMQQIATSWLAYRVTGSSAAVGATLLLAQLPILLLGPFAGVAGDRFDRQKLLLMTQVAGGLQALCFGISITYGRPTLSLLLGFSAALGLVNALDTPIRQSLVPRLVDRREDIRNAVALNSVCLHVARFIGATVATLLLTRFAESTCVFVNAASYAASLGALIAIGPVNRQGMGNSANGSFREGLRFCVDRAEIRAAFALLTVASLIVAPYPTLLPAAIRAAGSHDAGYYARLMACAAAGSVAAALLLARWHSDRALLRAIPISLSIAGVALGGLGLAIANLPAWAGMISVGVTALALTIVVSGVNAFIQHHVPDRLRGRVMGLYALSFNGLLPLGGLLAGALADAASPPVILAVMGIIAVVCAVGGAVASHRSAPDIK